MQVASLQLQNTELTTHIAEVDCRKAQLTQKLEILQDRFRQAARQNALLREEVAGMRCQVAVRFFSAKRTAVQERREKTAVCTFAFCSPGITLSPLLRARSVCSQSGQ